MANKSDSIDALLMVGTYEDEVTIPVLADAMLQFTHPEDLYEYEARRVARDVAVAMLSQIRLAICAAEQRVVKERS